MLVSAVINGTKREHILETLTADYRGMTVSQSTQMLEDLFESNGGEFKKENRNGYLYGIVLCFGGIISLCLVIIMLAWKEFKLRFLILALGIALFSLIRGPVLIVKSIRGNYIDTDDPFRQ